jgi:hypothetical protein
LSILGLCQWIESTPVANGIREGLWWFPFIETIHTLGIILVAGTILILDLRLLGVIFRKQSVSDIAQQVLPLTWSGFAVMLISGSFLFCPEAVKCYQSTFFRIKLVLLLLAGLNALAFHFTIYRNVTTWGDRPVPPLRARLAGLLSITFWIAIIAAGRALGYEISK